MAVSLNPYIEKLTWDEARLLIQPVNGEFVALIDNIEIPEGCEIFKVRYGYGDFLLEDGVFRLPNSEGQPVCAKDDSIPEEVRKKFAYAPTIPMGMTINKMLEVYLMSGSRVVPIALHSPGSIFALTGVLMPEVSYDRGAHWYVCSGSRLVFSTSKFSERRRYNKVNRELGTGAQPPVELLDHFETFKALSRSSVGDPWVNEVLYFTGEWVGKSEQRDALALKLYFFEKTWRGTAFFRNLFLRDAIFSRLEALSNVRLDHHILNYVRHIISIGAGCLPGLSFAADDSAFPKTFLKNVLVDLYHTEYAPTFMSMCYLNHDLRDPVYYSLLVPTLLDFKLRTLEIKSKSDELRDLQYSLKKILMTIQKEDLRIEHPDFPITKGASQTDYSFYHYKEDQGHQIIDAGSLPLNDKALQRELLIYKDLPFCAEGRLHKGLVMMKPKRKKKID